MVDLQVLITNLEQDKRSGVCILRAQSAADVAQRKLRAQSIGRYVGSRIDLSWECPVLL